jgi:hypothetical protein
LTAGNTTSCNENPPCLRVELGFAWNHGDFQEQITKTWLGIVGPRVFPEGVRGDFFSDHTDNRPTMLSLAGLKDDYQHDGRVLFEVLHDDALPSSAVANKEILIRLAHTYKEINAPRGTLGRKTLTGISTRALKGDDATFVLLEAKIDDITTRRNAIAGQAMTILEAAEFGSQPVDETQAEQLISHTTLQRCPGPTHG